MHISTLEFNDPTVNEITNTVFVSLLDAAAVVAFVKNYKIYQYEINNLIISCDKYKCY